MGIAFTDSAARYVGWHAITILRVAADPAGVVRVYFFNPNNDSGQDWGDDVVVDTAGNGERPGESSLPFEQFASRLYIFHADPLEDGGTEDVPADAVERILGYVERSWGRGRMDQIEAPTSAALDPSGANEPGKSSTKRHKPQNRLRFKYGRGQSALGA